MLIGGLQKFSLLDYPNKISGIIFTQGCNFRCHFCYNPMLVWPLKLDQVEIKKQEGRSLVMLEDDLFVFLESRVNKIDAIVITGGEPTLHSDLPEFINKIKNLGYLIKLDSNGTNPEMLEVLIKSKQLDYIAMDLKAPLEKYSEVVGAPVNIEKIKKSIDLIMTSGIAYEFRTTVAPGFLIEDDFYKMADLIKGADKWYLQHFKCDMNLLDNNLKQAKNYTMADLEKFANNISGQVKFCGVR